ncbi:MAG TPA: hypothetical protein PLF40_13725 [Kofleriaceae bacterium]|nr:hypothetical protein [Kofleriaceae bacterium]
MTMLLVAGCLVGWNVFRYFDMQHRKVRIGVAEEYVMTANARLTAYCGAVQDVLAHRQQADVQPETLFEMAAACDPTQRDPATALEDALTTVTTGLQSGDFPFVGLIGRPQLPRGYLEFIAPQ